MNVADKRAALELHKLSARDRQWVLSRLPAAQSSRVLPMLAELDGLDVRFDMESVATPAGDDPANHVPTNAAPAPDAPSARASIRAASAADVLHILADEPLWLARAVLALDAWPWSAPVRKAMLGKDVARREPSIGQSDPPPPPALAAALLPLFAERLRDAAGTPRLNGHANGHHGGLNGFGTWGRVWPRVRQWLP